MAPWKIHKNLESAQKQADARDKLLTWIKDNIVVGSDVRFAGMRSTQSYGKEVYRKVVSIEESKYSDKITYHNPSYISFEIEDYIPDFKKFRSYWTDPPYKEAHEKYLAQGEEITHPYKYVFVKSKNINIYSQNYHPEKGAILVAATNDAQNISEVFIDGEWKKIKDILKNV